MTRLLRNTMLACCGIVAFGYGAEAQAVKGTCRSSDEMSVRVVEYFQSIVTPRTSADTAPRAGLDLEGVTPAQITYVSDPAICTKAATAMNKLAQVPQPQDALYVVTSARRTASSSRPAGPVSGSQ